MCVLTLRGFRDVVHGAHYKKGSRKGVEDKTGCERATTVCVQPLDGGVWVIDHFCSASRTLKRSPETKSEAA